MTHPATKRIMKRMKSDMVGRIAEVWRAGPGHSAAEDPVEGSMASVDPKQLDDRRIGSPAESWHRTGSSTGDDP